MVHGMKIYNLVRLPEGETLTESTDLPISNKVGKPFNWLQYIIYYGVKYVDFMYTLDDHAHSNKQERACPQTLSRLKNGGKVQVYPTLNLAYACQSSLY